MKVDQEYCIKDYWLDYPRQDRVTIDKVDILTEEDKKKIRSGETVGKPDRGGTYRQYFRPIKYNDII